MSKYVFKTVEKIERELTVEELFAYEVSIADSFNDEFRTMANDYLKSHGFIATTLNGERRNNVYYEKGMFEVVNERDATEEEVSDYVYYLDNLKRTNVVEVPDDV